MQKKTALEVIGGLSQTTKMPCNSFSIPAKYCRMGASYRLCDKTVCHHCYCYERGNYTWPTVKLAQERRYIKLMNAINSGPGSQEWERYVDAFSFLLSGQEYFRWHDSGDLQGSLHLRLIYDICNNTRNTMHRLPTKEVQTLIDVSKNSLIPHNLNVQISSPYLDVKAERFGGLQLATTYRGCNAAFEASERDNSLTCPATIPNKSHVCGDCRACWWNHSDINYILH